MEKSSTIWELVAAYERFAGAEDLTLGATVEAPATTPVCASAAASYLFSKTAGITYAKGC